MTRGGLRQTDGAPALFKGEVVGIEPGAEAGIVAGLIGWAGADSFAFRPSGIVTTNEHASSTLVADTLGRGFDAGGGWDPTSFDVPSGLIEQESFFF